MRQAFAAALIFSIGTASAAPALSGDPLSPSYRIPSFPGGPSFRREGTGDGSGPRNPGVTAPLVPAPKLTQPKLEASQAEQIDDLFQRLSHAQDSDEADSLAHAIERLWLHSGSDTADLLMVRSVAALGKGNLDVAAALLDRIVVIDPDWAEAWNKRATLRFLKGDDVGAMQDIAETLAREPRHFGALSGMSVILQRNGMDKSALALIRRAKTIYPHNAELEKLDAELSLKVEGRDI